MIHPKKICFALALVTLLGACNRSTSFDPSELREDMLMEIAVDSKPIFILRRRQDSIADLEKRHALITTPVKNCPECSPASRSIKPDIFVVWGYNPQSGCKLTYVVGTGIGLEDDGIKGRGGFADKCTGAEYDLSGRKIPGSMSGPIEMDIPPHKYAGAVLEIY